ncbi:MAG: sulfite exporter TauE/SafE family protein [Duodenibacillus sp.]|nr:sulfite exporter TauE/SafE family protein [Duodenibacillus sp.]
MLETLVAHLPPIVCVFTAAFLQAITGFGLVIIAAPLLMFFYDPKLVVLMMVFLSLCSNTWQSLFVFRQAHHQTVFWMIVGAIVSQPIGFFVYDAITPDGLRMFIGVLLLISLIVMQTFKVKIPISPRNSAITGSACGLMSITTGMGGPPLILYTAYSDLSASQIRATCILFFFFNNIVSIATYVVGGAAMAGAIKEAVWLLPGIFLGVACGSYAFHRVSAGLFRKIIFTMLLGMCLYMIWQGLKPFVV